MMVECLFERLYLARDGKDSKNDVYVEKCPFIQHQLDGIRFLYKAYRKNKPGVILNDPSGYGKRVQTALFLSAVLPMLDKPVLILCKEGREPLWLDHFLKWTQVSNDVTVELTNPFIKKKVLVTPSYNAAAFARRDWSIIIVDDWLSKDLLKATLRTGLRVWITSTNVKDDLSFYSTFHSWIYPKDKFCAEKFKAKAHDLRDVIAKAVMLDAFFEDTVLRRTNFNTPFPTTQVPIQAVESEEKPRTKKNKDATGTKIKRTKRKSVDTQNTEIEDMPRKVARVENINKNNDRVNVESKKVKEYSEGFKTGVIYTNDEDLTQLKYKRNQKKIVLWDSDSEDDNVTNVKESNKINTNESQSLPTLHYDSESDSDRDAAVNISNELNITRTNAADNYATNTIYNIKDNVKDVEDTTVLPHDEIPFGEANSEIQVEIHQIPVANEVSYDISNKCDNMKEDGGSLRINNEINRKSPYTKDEIHKIPHEVKNDIKFSEDLFSADLSYKSTVDEIIQNAQEVKNNTVNGRENEKTEQVKPDKAPLSSFDLKLKQLEEISMKKFKGTFFDSIF